MPIRNSLPSGDLDRAISFFQVDRSWYENYWLKEREPRPARMVTRNLSMIASRLRLVWDSIASVRRSIALRPNTKMQS
jgi:hypothetical protein